MNQKYFSFDGIAGSDAPVPMSDYEARIKITRSVVAEIEKMEKEITKMALRTVINASGRKKNKHGKRAN